MHAFLDTDLDLYYEGGVNWMNYAAFCARVSTTPEGAKLMDVHFDAVVLKLVSILKRGLTNKLLHGPTQALHDAQADERQALAALIERLYRPR